MLSQCTIQSVLWKQRPRSEPGKSSPTAATATSFPDKFYDKERLLACSLEGSVFEVDFHTLSHVNVTDSYGGTAWSIDLPGKSASNADSLAVGCEDGFI